MTYRMHTTLKKDYDKVRADLIAALKDQGFGILTTIDVQATLKEKLNEDMERYEILGACNPQLAHTALAADRSIGLLLPCNVVLREQDGVVEVSILDPEAMFSVVDETVKGQLAGLPQAAKERLSKALNALKGVTA